MASAQRQSEATPNCSDWLTVEQASALCSESLRTWRRKAAWEQKRADQCKRVSLAILATPASGKGKPVWWLHRKIDKRLSKVQSTIDRDDRARESMLSKGYPQHAIEFAYKRATWLRRWLDACQRRKHSSATVLELAETIVNEARQAEGINFSISVRTLQRWERQYKAIGSNRHIAGIEALIDRRAVTKPLNDDDESSTPLGRSPDAVAYFYSLYHCQSQPSVKLCHELTVREARHRGWEWATSYGSTRKWLKTHDNLPVSYLLREGKDAFCRRFMPYIEIDYTSISPGQLYQTDHHQCDFWVEYEGKQLRPWLTVTQDARSRAIVGWHLGPSPHQDAIIANYLMAFRHRASAH